MTRAQAYRRTLYSASDVVVRVGQRSASAETWMAQHGTREAGFITAWNPMSRVMPVRWNAAAQARLLRDLKGVAVRIGEGRLNRWREDMLLASLPHRRLRNLASRYRQAAIVLLQRGRKARLSFTASPQTCS